MIELCNDENILSTSLYQEIDSKSRTSLRMPRSSRRDGRQTRVSSALAIFCAYVEDPGANC